MEQKKRLKEEKERRKAYETPEEKRERRLRKKQLKDYKRKEKLGWTNDIIHYDNDENPFGDSSLTKTFRWDKKLEKDGMKNIKDDELDRLAQSRIVEQKQELEKVKQARLLRERERMERQEMEELEQRSRETDKFAKWKADEDQFHLGQTLLRSTIRIQDGQAGPSLLTSWSSISAPRASLMLWRCTSSTPTLTASRRRSLRTCWRTSRFTTATRSTFSIPT